MLKILTWHLLRSKRTLEREERSRAVIFVRGVHVPRLRSEASKDVPLAAFHNCQCRSFVVAKLMKSCCTEPVSASTVKKLNPFLSEEPILELCKLILVDYFRVWVDLFHEFSQSKVVKLHLQISSLLFVFRNVEHSRPQPVQYYFELFRGSVNEVPPFLVFQRFVSP